MADRLENAYEKVFGSRASKEQLYAGFFLLLAGVVLALAGIVVFQVAPADYEWREAAIVLASLSAPSIFLGIFWALPSKASMRVVAAIGAGACLLGTILFVFYYPLQFNAPGNEQFGYPDRTGVVVGVYAFGLAFLLGGTFTSLIGYYVGRITVAQAAAGRAASERTQYEAAQRHEYDIPDAVIERDIELAEKRYKYSWGGGASSESMTGIQLNVPDQFEAGVKVGGKGVARTVQMDSPQVDDATKRLRAMRPTTDRSLPGQWAEDTTKALLEFRKKKEALESAKPAASVGSDGGQVGEKRPGLWARLWQWMTGKRTTWRAD